MIFENKKVLRNFYINSINKHNANICIHYDENLAGNYVQEMISRINAKFCASNLLRSCIGLYSKVDLGLENDLNLINPESYIQF